MFSIERYLGTLKAYVRNRARLEGSIAEGYVVTEALNYHSQYLSNVDRHERYEDRSSTETRMCTLEMFEPVGRGLGKKNYMSLSPTLHMKAWLFSLNNFPEVQPYKEYEFYLS